MYNLLTERCNDNIIVSDMRNSNDNLTKLITYYTSNKDELRNKYSSNKELYTHYIINQCNREMRTIFDDDPLCLILYMLYKIDADVPFIKLLADDQMDGRINRNLFKHFNRSKEGKMIINKQRDYVDNLLKRYHKNEIKELMFSDIINDMYDKFVNNIISIRSKIVETIVNYELHILSIDIQQENNGKKVTNMNIYGIPELLSWNFNNNYTLYYNNISELTSEFIHSSFFIYDDLLHILLFSLYNKRIYTYNEMVDIYNEIRNDVYHVRNIDSVYNSFTNTLIIPATFKVYNVVRSFNWDRIFAFIECIFEDNTSKLYYNSIALSAADITDGAASNVYIEINDNTNFIPIITENHRLMDNIFNDHSFVNGPKYNGNVDDFLIEASYFCDSLLMKRCESFKNFYKVYSYDAINNIGAMNPYHNMVIIDDILSKGG